MSTDKSQATIASLEEEKMSGHSKWNNIKNRKEALDSKKSKVFGQISKLIRIAVKEGDSGDPQHNVGLRTVLDKARAANMPKDKIQKAIDRGLGKSTSGRPWQEAIYEAFGPQGEAYLILVITDNPNRSSGELRFILSRAGGSLAGPGSAKFLFERSPDNQFVPKIPMVLDQAGREQVLGIMDSLLENDEVEEVFCSVAISEN
ncbi:MAG TPA: YebC/PmpR family DNA-binding transcriptional regulator [Candidatus Woesebacteria bacterium]|nr:YebC/PmpR family DNA-binding transcriptional regulator [Candidatus Woesebacteria bacterium]